MSMLSFEPYSFSRLPLLRPWLEQFRGRINDFSLGALFMWQEGTDLQYAIRNETIVFRQEIGDQAAFSYPIGKDPDGMIDALLSHTLENSLPLRFYGIEEAALSALKSDPRLSPIGFSYTRKWSDYLYSFEEALTFSGKKYSGQRNHINKFTRLYGEPVIRKIEHSDIDAIEKMLLQYALEHPSPNALEEAELDRTRRLLHAFETLGLYGACLTVDGKIAAFSIGEVRRNMLLIHVEKALLSYEGAYPVMYQGFVRFVQEHVDHEITLVNREDDSGDPGIRTSKMQYHPVEIVHKYLVRAHAPLAGQDAPVLQGDRVFLTPLRETDKAAYLKLNTDDENNRLWGYDYRSDMDITLPVDEETFFDAARRDMAAGDSINFAIRKTQGGPLIGEGILWQFTEDRRAEIGCRLFPAYHGKGYGREAFRLLNAYAAEKLGQRPYARCYSENSASRNMILSNGFREVCSDGTYSYCVAE